MQETFKDTAIREALRRIHANVPPLSDDFDEKLFAKLEQRRRQRRIRRLVLWPSIAAAAVAACIAIAFVFGKGVTNKNTNEGDFAGTKKESVPAPAVTTPATSANINTAKAPKSVNKLGEMVAPISREEMEPPAVAEDVHEEKRESAPVPLTTRKINIYELQRIAFESKDQALQEQIANLHIVDNSGVEGASRAASLTTQDTEPQLAENGEKQIAEPEEEMQEYNDADLPITNPENLILTEEDIQKLRQIKRQCFIAEIRSTLVIARIKLERTEKIFVQQ